MQTRSLAPNAVRAKIVIGAFLTFIFSTGVLCVVGLIFLLRRESIGSLEDYERVVALHKFIVVYENAHLLVYYFLVVCFILWFGRAYYNLGRLVKRLEWGRGFAIGGWFIPIGSWYIPWSIYSEMAKGYGKVIEEFAGARDEVPDEQGLLSIGRAWWITYIMLTFLLNLVSLFTGIAQVGINYFYLVASLLLILPAVLGIGVVRRMMGVELAVYRIWISGEYAELQEEREMAEAEAGVEVPGERKRAGWYRSAAEAERQLGRSEDPFQ